MENGADSVKKFSENSQSFAVEIDTKIKDMAKKNKDLLSAAAIE